jgi:sulfate transporter 3
LLRYNRFIVTSLSLIPKFPRACLTKERYNIKIGISNTTLNCTGAFSRSAVNHNAGAKTAASNIVMSVTVMVTLLFLMPLFQYTPNVVLGAIIVTAVVGLIDIPAAYAIWKVDKFDFVVLLCAFVGVIFISVQQGLAIAVCIDCLCNF